MNLPEKLESASNFSIVMLALLQILALGIIDFCTGFEFSFAVFYLVPVATTAWYSEKRFALFISVISAVTWQLSNRMAGETFHHWLIPVWNASTRLAFFVTVTLLLAKLKDSHALQKNLAQTDFLTGAANARSFQDILNMEILRSRRFGRTFSLCYLDADNFKAINDTLGHRVGNDVLKKVVETARKSLRITDTVARLGGDEFAILLPETDETDARIVIENLREHLLAEMKSHAWNVTFSMGVLTCSEAPDDVHNAIESADNLMYRIKKSGKNAVGYSRYLAKSFA